MQRATTSGELEHDAQVWSGFRNTLVIGHRGATMLKFAIVGFLLLASVANAQETSSAEPNIGDIMTFQQERHLKLWLAGHGGNWPLADYEIGKLKDGFEDLDKLLGGDTVGQHVGAPISAIEKAIEKKDKDTFARAFDQLTAGCNGCHQTLDHAFIVIQRPTASPYGNQNFAPQK
jgi:hypothetical protein